MLNKITEDEAITLIEKLLLINNANFKGHEKLLINFEDESNNYISEVFFSQNNFIKTLFSFINVKPAENNDINNKTLLDLKNIKNLIIKKKYAKSIQLLSSIDNEKKYFIQTFEQLYIGKDFYSNLEEITNND